MNVSTVPLQGGLAMRVVGFVNEWGYSIAQLAARMSISEPDAMTLYIRSANYIIGERESELAELNHRLNVIAARA